MIIARAAYPVDEMVTIGPIDLAAAQDLEGAPPVEAP